MFALALPVVLAELGWMTMGIVDTLMVGRISPEAIGAVGIGTSLFMGVCIFAMGLLLGLDTLVSQAFGAGRVEECHRWLFHGVALAILLTVPISLVLFGLSATLPHWGLDPEVLRLAAPYFEILTWSILPLLLYASFRRYLQGMGVVRPVMIALVAANLLNVLVNWILIYGKLGAPALGVRGSAWATVIARVGMAGFLLGVIVYRERGRRPGLFETSLAIEMPRMRRLVALGAPAAGQVTLEVGAFAAATALAGRLAPLHVVGVRRVPARAARAHRRVHIGCARTRDRRVAALRRRDLPALRRRAGGRDGRPARPRRYAHAHAVEPRGTLVPRPAARLRAVLFVRARRDRPLVGALHGSHHLRRRAPDCLDSTDSRAGLSA